ncbi:MAG: tRNA guanosine(15) transglycosylase TgtA [Candidatus Hodarchaeota archaeon]
MAFELKYKDGLGKIGTLETRNGIIETPCLLPVINPIRQNIAPSDLKKAGTSAVITNAFLIYTNDSTRRKALESGVHKVIGWQGPVMTDSGAFQLMQYGDIDITNEVIIKFQCDIGSDIGIILDIPVAKGPRKDFEKAVQATLKRAEEFEKLEKSEQILWMGPIQGGPYIDLVTECARILAKLPFDLHALGSVVPLLEEYSFSTVVEMIFASKQQVPLNRPLHLFGAGHPMFFGFAVLLGCDLFDSAAYALFAKENRYLTPYGTYNLENLEYFPCSCPICTKIEPNDVLEMNRDEKENVIAIHNLYVSFQELNLIKQSIREGSLWRLVSERIAAHPHLVDAWKTVFERKYIQFIERFEPLSKKRALFITRQEMLQHPLIIRHLQRMLDAFYVWSDTLLLTRTKHGITPSPGWQICIISDVFGLIPLEIQQKYPLLQYKSYKVFINQEEFLRTFLERITPYFKKVLIHQSVEAANSLAEDYGCELVETVDSPSISSERYDEFIARSFLVYQFGLEAENAIVSPKIHRSKRTGRIGWIYDKKTPMASIRARDFVIIPRIKLAKVLHQLLPNLNMRVIIDKAAEPFVRKGKSVFAKFVRSAWEGIRSGDEVLVVNEMSDLVGTGTAILAPLEMLHFKKGIAVKTREGLSKTSLASC